MSEPNNKSETRLREQKKSGALGCLLAMFLVVLFFIAAACLQISEESWSTDQPASVVLRGLTAVALLTVLLIGFYAIQRYRWINAEDAQLKSLIERWPNLQKKTQQQIIRLVDEDYAAVGYQGRVATDQQPDSSSAEPNDE